MGWAWHKLYPQTTGFFPECPADFLCPSCVENQENCSGTVCYGYCPNGVGICELETCIEVNGNDCSWTVYPLPGVDRYSRQGGAGRPSFGQELGQLYCTGPNDLTDVNGDLRQINPCDYESNSAGNAYYYASPSSPTSPPAAIKKQPYAMAFNGHTIPSRVQVISGFNRYRYTGYMAYGANCDGEYSMVRAASRGTNPENAQNLMVGSLPTTPNGNIPYGVTGISGMENSLGREFPLPDSVIANTLFGGYTAQYRVLPTCTEGETEPDPTWSVGHYAPNPFGVTGAQKGSFSFQCYNAHSYYNDNNSYGVVGIPTCSVWSLLYAIYYKIHADMLEFYGNSFNPANINPKIRPDWWKTVDPAGISADGTQMVRWVMNRFAEGVAEQGTDNPTSGDLGGNFLYPNIFLWNDIEFTAAATANKWKHLFVIGNANILQDTSCTSHSNYDEAMDPPCVQGRGGRHHFTLDECSHGSTGAIRLYSDPEQTFGNFIGYGYQPNRARYLVTPACSPNGGPCYFGSDGGHTSNFIGPPGGFGVYAQVSVGRLSCIPYDGLNNFCLQTLAFPGSPIPSELRKLCPEITSYFGHLDDDGVPKDGCDPTKN